MALLEIHDILCVGRQDPGAQVISLSVEEREIETLVGANGAGKSTTLCAISGLRTGQGAIRYGAAPLGGWRAPDRRSAWCRCRRGGVSSAG